MMPSTTTDTTHTTASADHLSIQHPQQPLDVEAIALAYLAGMHRNTSGVTETFLPKSSSSAIATTNAQEQLAHSVFAESFGDDKVIAQAIVKGRNGGQTIREALEALHGVKKRSAQWWKDYYMEYSESINDLVARCADPRATTAKYTQTVSAPSLQRFTVQDLWSVKSTTDAVTSESTRAEHRHDSGGMPANTAEGLGARNKLDVDDSVDVISKANEKLPASLSLSLNVPSHPPNPPTKIERVGFGNKFTEDDRDFFVKFILWELSRDSSLTRTELIRSVAEKARHHSHGSWSRFCYKGKPRLQLDYLLAAAQAGKLGAKGSIDVPSLDEAAAHQTDAQGGQPLGGIPSAVPDQIKVEDSTHLPRSTEDYDPPVSEREKKAIARYVASQPAGWNGQAGSTKWRHFQIMHPQRTWRAWKSIYHDYHQEITRLKRANILSESRTRISQHKGVGGSRPVSSTSRLSLEVIVISSDEEDVVRGKRRRISE